MVQLAFLPVEGAHLAAATDVVAIKRTYQRSGFAGKTEIKGFLCRYATAGNSYWQQAYGIGKSQRLATDEGGSVEPNKLTVDKEEEVTTDPTELFIEARETMLLAEHKADERTSLGLVLSSREWRRRPASKARL